MHLIGELNGEGGGELEGNLTGELEAGSPGRRPLV